MKQASRPFPVLPTNRLLLRQLAISDAPEIMQLRSDPRVNEFLDRPGTTSLEEARQFIEKIEAGITNGESLYWALSPKDEGRLIGTICLWNFSADRARAEIGYELSPAYQGQGLMQEALAAVIAYGFGPLQLKVIAALLRADNIRSVRLLEKNGFRPDTEFKYVKEEEAGGLAVYYLAL